MRLFWFGIAWLTGIVIGRMTGLPAATFLVGAALAAAVMALGEGWLRRLGPGILLFSLGAIRFALAAPQIDHTHVATHNDQLIPLELTGLVSDFPDVRDDYIGLRVEVEQIRYPGSIQTIQLSGMVLIEADRYRSFSYGDRVRAVGFLETPPEFEQFSYREYLARQGVFSYMPNALVETLDVEQGNPLVQRIFALRARALEVVYQLFPDPEASLLAGILLGVETGISRQVREAFNVTGTTHIIAISGFNLTILAALVISLFGRWLGIRRGAIAAALTIGIYTVLVGADPAVVRAAIMGGLALFARFLGRRSHALASLAAAAVLMTAFNPVILWDVGFQLSFAATLGLVLYADPIERRFTRITSRWLPPARAQRFARPASEYLLFTIAAQITTLPLAAAYFHRLSIASLLANPVILPAQPPLMMLGGLATMAGLVWLPLGKIIALLAWPFPAFTIRAVNLFASLPSASIDLGPVSFLPVALFYVILFGATAFAALPPAQRPNLSWLPRPSVGLSLLALAALTGVVSNEAAARPDGMTHLSVFESGGTLIETPAGRFVLLSGGDSPVALSQGLGRRMPLLHRQLDWLIVTDSHRSQVASLLDLSDRYRIHRALIPALDGGVTYQRVLRDLQDAGVSVMPAEVGQALQLGQMTRLQVLDLGEGQISLLLIAGRARVAMLPGSRRLSDSGLPMPGALTALIVHDPFESEWLSSLHPMLGIASGLPRNATAWQLRTELHGWIELVSDGEQFWVWSEHSADSGR